MTTNADRAIDTAVHCVAAVMLLLFLPALAFGGLWFIVGAVVLWSVAALALAELSARLRGFDEWLFSAPYLMGMRLTGWFQLATLWIGGGLGVLARHAIGST